MPLTELNDEERDVLREAEQREIELDRRKDKKRAETVDQLVSRTFLKKVSKDDRSPETYSITQRGISILQAWYADRDMADTGWMQVPQD